MEAVLAEASGFARIPGEFIAASRIVKRFMGVVELTNEELTAVQDDCNKLEASTQRTQHLPVSTTLRRRTKEAKSQGIPLTVLNRNG